MNPFSWLSGILNPNSFLSKTRRPRNENHPYIQRMMHQEGCRRKVGAVYQVQPPRRQAWIKRRVTEASSNPSFFILLQIDLGSHAPRNPGVMHEHESCWQELIPDPFPFCLTSVQRRGSC
ncbi:hypothetical protein AVEN_205469-1 [Araneus ventricosus]|uniref:Uncharacterized protein n=1 Tax=Araneus ventricosus TaxID=182803 RepID=A0A4Y2CD56_ARAVE|nr:hypothetical protein AVEN_205469-1 [Araneus ventricosus]